MSKELKHSIDFLNQKVGKETGFSTPENYFNEVEDTIYASTIINSFSKEKPFSTPANYFNTIEDSILSKINSKEKEVKVISLRKRILQYVPTTAAASVLLFVGINYFNTQKTTLDDITINEIESWYENGYGTTYNEELASAISIADIEEELFTSISEESIEDYIIVNNTLLSDDIE
ncbi:hypothetical protein [Tenacibaculum crassostreae]|uniref:hypothetical protein n=1 Tax=Tenacibaculum crassostreae TaxID=502683 RepID=UPI003893BCA7